MDELVTLFSARGPEVAAVAALADELRAAAVGDVVTWVSNRNINYTNVCTFKCRFCGFSKGPLSLNLRGTPYLLTLDDIAGRVREAWDSGATEVCLQGGIHPRLRRRLLPRRLPGGEGRGTGHPRPRLHRAGGHRGRPPAGRTARVDYLRRLMEAGLRSLPGHRGRDPRRSRPGRSSAPTRSTPTVAGAPPDRPLASACGRTSRSCSAPIEQPRAPGPATSCAPGTCRRRRAGSPSSSACRSSTWRRRSTCSARPAGGRRSARSS